MSATLREFAAVNDAAAATTKKLQKQAILAEYFRTLDDEDLRLSVRYALPVGFGVLTVDTMEQALERAGGAAGNKGREAAEAAIRAADVLNRLRTGHA